MHRARVLDFDRTIIRKINGTLLELVTLDYLKEQGLLKKIDLFFRSGFVKAAGALACSVGKVFNDSCITGETTSMKAYDVFVLRKAGIPLSFIEERAKEYAKFIEPKHIAAFKKCKDDVYIVSAEPVQFLELIVKYAGLSEYIKKIYGTKFKVENGIITGFEWEELAAGTHVKYLGMRDIISNGYSEIHAIGDSMSDIGLFKKHKGRLIPYTFSDADPKLVDYVKKNNGIIVNSLDDFFNT